MLSGLGEPASQGKFKLKVAEGVPYFQFRFQLNFQDAPLHKSHHNPHQHPHYKKQRLGPARQSRDRLRLRAAEHQAKSAVAASVIASCRYHHITTSTASLPIMSVATSL